MNVRAWPRGAEHTVVPRCMQRFANTETPPSWPRSMHSWLDDAAWQPLRRYVEDCLVLRDPFELWLDAAAVWRNGCAVLLPSAVPAALVDLQQRLDLALQAAGVPADGGGFTPHVTLARGARSAVPPPLTPLRWVVRRHVLVESSQRAYRVMRAD